MPTKLKMTRRGRNLLVLLGLAITSWAIILLAIWGLTALAEPAFNQGPTLPFVDCVDGAVYVGDGSCVPEDSNYPKGE